MAVREHTAGNFYLATVRLSRFFCPPHGVEIREIAPPWRRGSAFVVPFGFLRRGLVVGAYDPRSAITEEAVDDEIEPWLDGHALDVTAQEIGTWNGLEEEESTADAL